LFFEDGIKNETITLGAVGKPGKAGNPTKAFGKNPFFSVCALLD